MLAEKKLEKLFLAHKLKALPLPAWPRQLFLLATIAYLEFAASRKAASGIS